MDKPQILKWLKEKKQTREWLAGELGVSKGTIDQWFSKKFPEWAVKAIVRLEAQPIDLSSGLEVSFTAAEFETIEQARKLSEHPTRSAYYHTAIMAYTDDILAREADEPTKLNAATVIAKRPKPLASHPVKTGGTLYPFPGAEPEALVAEDAPAPAPAVVKRSA